MVPRSLLRSLQELRKAKEDSLRVNFSSFEHYQIRQSPLRRVFVVFMVPRRGLEPPRPCGRYHLKVVRLPFRHLGIVSKERESARARSVARETGERKQNLVAFNDFLQSLFLFERNVERIHKGFQ